MDHKYQKMAPSVLRANVVTVNPQSGCGNCILRHGKIFKTTSNATVVTHEEKHLLSPHSFHYYVQNEVLLSTAHVLIQEPSGNYTQCRALLDSGSQVSFISRACVAMLKLDTKQTHLHVAGVGASNMGTIHHSTAITLRSIHDPMFIFGTEAYVVPEVTGDLPTISFNDATAKWPHLSLLKLADPEYNLTRGIDLLLGAECFPTIMRNEVRFGTEGQPMGQATVFGWVLLGQVPLKVELVQQLQHDVDTDPISSSSRSPMTKFSDRQKHSHRGPCWFMDSSNYSGAQQKS